MNLCDDLRLEGIFVDKNVDDVQFVGKIKVALIGYSVDEGEARNGDKIGSRKGPEVVFNLLRKKCSIFNAEYNLNVKNIIIKEYGRTTYSGDLKDTHKQHTKLVLSALEDGYFPIIIGGGHDQSFPNFVALSTYLSTGVDCLKVINVDAHLDVCPTLPNDEPFSASPFRQILERKNEQKIKLIEFASQGSQCSSDHAKYVLDNNGCIIWLNKLSGHSITDYNTDTSAIQPALTKFQKCLQSAISDKEAMFMIFDLDSIQSSDCPGVCYPSPMGLTAREALSLCFEGGRNPTLRMFEISEFNPDIESDRTAILVVHMIYSFLLGLSTRV